ncbi:cation:proton antiporter [Breoghania sp. L-A4]|uniref:cation:proton antiporter n=1 Tax=Breoghania sp. L-A4 TaxID=2304600 RepID=UPI000E35C465|nr:cation:proton antiporter [Breoghania sp. L-A4]AXS40110.1 cation:proton antiporter [Breoghania sp. L-A4]
MSAEHPFEVIVSLFVVLVSARLAGSAARRIGQPAVVGALLAGMAIATVSVFGVPYFELLQDSAAVSAAATAGMFIVLLAAAVEIAPSELAHSLRRGLIVAFGGVTVPLAAGFALALVFFPKGDGLLALAFLFGIDMSITAIPSALKVLSELGMLHAPLGRTIIAAALFDDVMGLLLVALMAAFTDIGGGTTTSIALDIGATVLGLLIYGGTTIAIGTRIFPHIHRGVKALDLAAAELFALVSVALAYAALAELLGLHWVLGPVMAGIFFEPVRIGKRGFNEVRMALGGISDGLLAPVFFCSVGMGFDPFAIWQAPELVALATSVAICGKLIGAGVPARMSGLSRTAAVAVGIGMTARGAVELVVLSVAVEAGLLDPENNVFHDNLYSALVATSVLSTLLAPLALRWWLKKYHVIGEQPGEPAPVEAGR